MATVKKNPAVTKIVEIEPESFDLHLTANEVSVLKALTGRCRIGSPAQPIFRALSEAGVKDGFNIVTRNNLPIRIVEAGESEEPF